MVRYCCCSLPEGHKMRSDSNVSQNEHHCDLLSMYSWDNLTENVLSHPLAIDHGDHMVCKYAVSLTNCCHESVLRAMITLKESESLTHCCKRHQIYLQRDQIITDIYFIVLLGKMLSDFHTLQGATYILLIKEFKWYDKCDGGQIWHSQPIKYTIIPLLLTYALNETHFSDNLFWAQHFHIHGNWFVKHTQ